MVEFPNLEMAVTRPADAVTPSDMNYLLKTIGQQVSIIRKHLGSPTVIPQKAGTSINFPYEEGITASHFSLDASELDIPEEQHTYIPNTAELSFVAVKSKWNKIRMKTTAVDIKARTVVKQADAIKTYENSMLTTELNTVIDASSPLAVDYDVVTTGTLAFKDLRRAGLQLQKRGFYPSAKHPYIAIVNEAEAYDLLADTDIVNLQNLYQVKSADLQQLDDKKGNLILETTKPFPMKVFMDANLDDDLAVLFDTYAGVQWAELQGFQGINFTLEGEKEMMRKFWTWSLLTVTTIAKKTTPATAGDVPGVVCIDI